MVDPLQHVLGANFTERAQPLPNMPRILEASHIEPVAHISMLPYRTSSLINLGLNTEAPPKQKNPLLKETNIY
jgi:hypothetical protein